jgi:endonuclease G
VSGTIFDEGFKTIGNGVGVPTRVWKVVYNRTNGETLAFLLPNQKYSSKEIPNFTVTVNDVEEATGINFFPELDEESEEKVVLAAWPEIFE